MLKYWKNKSGTPEHVDFHMTSRAIWEREYKPLLFPFDRERVGGVKAQRENLARWRARGKWTFFGSTLVWENMRASMGDYAMFMALVEDPNWMLDEMATACRCRSSVYVLSLCLAIYMGRRVLLDI